MISVLINNYNYAQFIGDTIESVLQQTYKDFELIIVDDGSTDGSLEVINSYAKQDSRILVIAQKNGGQAAAFNTGVAQAKGEILSFLDSDDLWKSNKLAVIHKTFQSHKSTCIIMHNLDMIDQQNCKLAKIFPGRRPGKHEAIHDMINHGAIDFTCPTSSISIRQETAKMIFPLSDSFTICADSLISLEAAFLGDVFVLEEVLGDYRVHDSNNWYGTELQHCEENSKRLVIHLTYLFKKYKYHGKKEYIRCMWYYQYFVVRYPKYYPNRIFAKISHFFMKLGRS